MERWKVFFNVGGVLAAFGTTFLILGLSRGVLAFTVIGATHLLVGCGVGVVGIGRKSKDAAASRSCSH
jgi:hypothetical protein